MDSEYNYDGILNYIPAWQYIPPTRIKSLSARLYVIVSMASFIFTRIGLP